MKKLKLTTGEVVLLDNSDWEKLSQINWYLSSAGYAHTEVRTYKHKLETLYPRYVVTPKSKVMMHRVILQASDTQKVDHKSRNKLDNRRSNLRFAKTWQNICNSPLRGGTSKYRGVSWHPTAEKWVAEINAESTKHYLGLFTDETQAALAYDRAAWTLHKDFAQLNFPGNLQYLLPAFVKPNIAKDISGFVGVYARGEKFTARVTVNKRLIYLGQFDSALEAATHRDNYIIKNKLTSRTNLK